MFNFNLELRKAHRNDLKNLMLAKQESNDMHHSLSIINEQDQIKWFESLDQNVNQPRNLVLIGMDKDNDIGSFRLSNINYIDRTADIACDIYKQYRGNGYGTRLIASGISFSKQILNLRKLSCEILENNIASRKMCEKNGFVQEGIRKEQIHKRGLYIDSIMYGLII
jgi:ribosomal-protein-alanine N-acetyltransferase